MTSIAASCLGTSLLNRSCYDSVEAPDLVAEPRPDALQGCYQ